MTHAKEKIQAMDDFQVVRFFEAFAQQLAAGTQTPFDAIKGSIPPSIKSLAGWEGIEGLSPERAAQVMEPTAAVETTRTLLTHLAEDATFGPLMNDFLATYRDDELVADVILTVGLVATVLLMAAAIEFEGQIGSVKFKKGKVDHKMISAVLGPFAKALGGSPRR